MKKLLLGLFVLGFLFTGFNALASDLDLTVSDSNKTFEVVKGQMIIITLCNPGDGGYQFDAPKYDSSILSLTSHTNVPIYRSDPYLTGGCYGNDVFKFQALNIGTAKLEITASQGWSGGDKANMFNSTFIVVTSSNNPIISGISGPQTLAITQSGTWKVTASSSSGGNLTYSVIWGDEAVQTNYSTATRQIPQQTATFTHSYSWAGTFTPTFTVTSENTIRCFTIPCSSNEGSATTSLTVNVGNIPIICPQYVYDPNFCINGTIKELIGYNGCPSYSCIAPGDGCLYGNQFSITTGQLCPTTIPTTPIRRTLRRGLTGEDVKVLQTFLTNNGYNCGNADGSFGPITQAKVIEWQAQNGLTADGAFGAMSQAKAGFNQ